MSRQRPALATNSRSDATKPTIFELYEACIHQFSELEKCLPTPLDDRTPTDFSYTELLNERERFHDWAVDQGAHRRDSLALDRRLQQATQLYGRVVGRLAELRSTLERTRNLVDGDDFIATPIGRPIHHGSLTGFGISLPEESDPPPPYTATDTGLGHSKREIIHIITCLEKIELDDRAVAEHKDPPDAGKEVKPASVQTVSSGSFIDDESESFATDEDGNSRATRSRKGKAKKPSTKASSQGTAFTDLSRIAVTNASSQRTIFTDISGEVESLQSAITKLSLDYNETDLKAVGTQLRNAMKEVPGPTLLPVATDLITVLEEKSLLEEAEEWYQVAIKMAEDRFGEKSAGTTDILERAVTFFMDSKCETKALEFCLRLHEVVQKFHPDHDLTSLETLGKLATIYYSLCHYEEAEAAFLKLIDLETEQFGDYAHLTLKTKAQLVQTYLDSGQYEKAEELDVQVLEALRRAKGPQHVDTIKYIASRALNLRKQERYFEAEDAYDEAISLGTSVLGETDPFVMISKGELSMIYYQQERYKDAEDLLKVAVRSLEKSLGPFHTETLENKLRLGITYRQTRQFAKGEPLLEAVYARRSSTLGDEHPDTLAAKEELAGVYLGLGRIEDAQQIEMSILEFFYNAYGAEHAETLCQMGNFAMHYRNAGRLVEAEMQLQNVIAISERTLGISSPVSMLWNEALVTMLKEQKRWKEALPVQTQLFEVRRARMPEDSEVLIESARGLSMCLWGSGKKERAIEMLGKVVGRMERVWEDGYPKLIECRETLEMWIGEVEGRQRMRGHGERIRG